jgi:DNA helicase-2/ATP-dependent DNA helicase PcrA
MQASPTQEQIILAPLESQCIIAGPGSGKTFVLTQRIVSLLNRNLIRGTQCLALTFGVEASLELKHRLHSELGSATASTVTVQTLHALSLRLLKKYDSTYKIRTLCTKIERKLQLIERAIAPFRTMPLFPKEFSNPAAALWEAGQCIRSHPQKMLHPNYCSWSTILTKAIMNSFEKEGLFLFEFLCLDALFLLSRHSISLPYSAIFVDEFQDLTPVQFELIKELSPKDNTVLTIVGDPNQAIYGWRGGSPHLFDDACSHHKHIKKYHLAESFRCPQKIVEAANHLIKNNPDSQDTHITTKQKSGSLFLHRYNTREEELFATASRISSWIEQGISPASIAVLVRSSDLVQQMMLHLHQHNLPVQGENPLLQKEGIQLLALLQYLHDGRKLEQAINISERRMRSSTYRQLQNSSHLSTASLFESIQVLLLENQNSYDPLRLFIKEIDTFHISKKSIPDRLKDLFSALSFPDVYCDIPAQDRLLASITLVQTIAQNTPSLSLLIESLKDLQHHNLRDQACILVSTLHKAKGLEFSHVCILGNQNNIFPNFGLTKNEPEAVAEERRLLYVGMTRTKKELHLSNHTAPTNDTCTYRDGFLHEISDFLM